MQSLAESIDTSGFSYVACHRSDHLSELVSYWRAKHVDGRLPKRSDIDPAEIKAHLPYMFMIDVVDGGREYRFRLIGTELAVINGRDSTGKTFAEVYGKDERHLAMMREVVGSAVATRQPVRTAGKMFWRPDRAFYPVEGLILPLSSDGKTVDVLLGEIAVLPTPA